MAHVRNHLRRAFAGFKVLRDIRIPLVKANQHLLGDLYLPYDDGTKSYPVLLSSTVYGKRVVFSGPDPRDELESDAFEKSEDDWHSTASNVPLYVPNTVSWFHTWTRQRRYETIATFNTFTYVPRGFAMLKLDPRGVSQTPGVRFLPGQETADICEAIEWTITQSWCTGNVALTGNSYGANSQWRVAIAKPQGLKAIVPYAGDADVYRDAAYIGGIPMFDYLSRWAEGVRGASPRWTEAADLVRTFASMPFDNEAWRKRAADVSQIDIPCFLGASQMLAFHNRASYEVWRTMKATAKHLQIVDANYYGWPNHEAANKIANFLHRHLSGRTEVEVEPVGMQMQIGHGQWYWRKESEWPVRNTLYVRWYLHGDGTLTRDSSAQAQCSFTYAASPEHGMASGATFKSSPFEEDVEIAGHLTANVFISASSRDADVVVQVWGIDEADNELIFGTDLVPKPFALGVLRASHRRTDPEKDLPWRPWHTHTEKDNAPLIPNEIVSLEIEIPPAAVRIRRGWRLRVDVTPTEHQPGVANYHPPAFRTWTEEIHKNALNTLHVGPDYLSSVTIPVIPLCPIGTLGVVV